MAHSLTLASARHEAKSGEPGPSGGESGTRPGEPDLIDDRWARAIGIPGFGLIIPRVTGLLAGLGPAQIGWWIGTLWFMGIAFAIWHGNRWLLFEQRRHFGWFEHPLRKLSMLLAAIVLFTTPLTVGTLLAWYGWRGLTPEWDAIRTVVLINVICVVFVTHAYETVFLIKEREGDLLRVARLDRARAEAELAAFLAQVDPHFVFNSLNTLGHLIETDRERAATFNQDLAGVYRYLLRQRGRTLVPLREELAFCAAYLELMKIRHGAALRCELPEPDATLEHARLPPTGLQLLIENAIKHNEVGASAPLDIIIEFDPTPDAPAVLVRNLRRPRKSQRESAGIGLRNLDERSKLAVGRGLEIDQGPEFRVRVPRRLAFPWGAFGMTRVVIIEDELPARDRLIASLQQLDPQIEILAQLGSVAESIQWFTSHDPPELVFADVQLSDGLALDIFARVQPAAPIVFCTAYDEYMVEALAQNGIAYLLKPYSSAQLAETLQKYRRLEAHFTNGALARTQLAALARSLAQPRVNRRILAREGDAFVAVPLTEVAYFGVRDGLTELVHRDGRRLELDRTLSDLEVELAGAGLFRLNRQFLAQPDAVRGFRAYFKGRLLVDLQPPAGEDVVISQPNAARFRSWLEGV